MKNKILYHILFTVWWLFSLLPLWVHYRISDFLYYLVYYVIKYRRPIVRKNLTESFPDKSEAEIIKIEKEFYSWFCDYLVESVKMFSMSEKQMRRRMQFEDTEQVFSTLASGKSCAVYLGHYCNWEWIASLQLTIGENGQCGQIYHPLEDKVFDRLFNYMRSRWGNLNIPMAETIRELIKHRDDEKKMVIGFIADQVPFWNNIHYWTDFLHHDTPVLTGTERVAKKLDMACFYLDAKRIKRGYYAARFIRITDNPNEESEEFAITERYFREMEKTILRQPPYWLWTHNRWKRTREEWLKIVDPVTHKMKNIN